MKRFDRFSVTTTLALIVASSMAIAQSGSVLSDMSNPEVVAKGRAEAAAAIKCDTPSGWDAQMAAFRANAKSKWDHVAMDCAVKAGAAAIRDVSIPVNAIWAFVTFRVITSKQHLRCSAHIWNTSMCWIKPTVISIRELRSRVNSMCDGSKPALLVLKS